MGNLDRLRELFQAEPHLAQDVDKHGSLFFHLPDDEDAATDIAELLLDALPEILPRFGVLLKVKRMRSSNFACSTAH